MVALSAAGVSAGPAVAIIAEQGLPLERMAELRAAFPDTLARLGRLIVARR